MRVTARLMSGLLLAFCLVGCGRSGDDGGVATVGGQPSAAAAQSEADTKAAGLKYSQCMRENGVPSFPDPTIDDKGQMTFDAPDDVPDSVMNGAESKCRQHLPVNPARQGSDPQRLEGLRKYAQCMRDSGLTSYPDPNPDGSSRVNWQKLGVSGPDDPKLKAADEKCRDL